MAMATRDLKARMEEMLSAEPEPVVIQVALAEYLLTNYRPDREWIAGELRERNVGEKPHTTVQNYLAFVFRLRAMDWGVRGFPEQRVQTSPDRYRVADYCVVKRGVGSDPIVHAPPLLCVEVLSREDRMSEIQERVDDYQTMGVGAVWVIDPLRRRAFSAKPDGSLLAEAERLIVADTEIAIPVADIFAELDDLERNG